jgi:hypothetical protein
MSLIEPLPVREILLEFQDFLGSSTLDPGKTPLRQKYFRQEEFNQ